MPCDYYELPHAGIKSLAPYIPGKTAKQVTQEYGIKDIIKLASNENPLGCSPLVTATLASMTNHHIATYPGSSIQPLRQKIANQLEIDTKMITLGNGSDGLIPLVQTCFALHCGKHILTHQHAFVSYKIYAKTLGIPIFTAPLLPNWYVDIDTLIAMCNEKTALIFLASPNNPTGLLVSQAKIEHLLQHIPETTILVVDEAYYEYVDDNDKLNMISLLSTYPNLIAMRTFSKAYGLASLRLGYTIASSDVSAILQRVQPPFAVNEAALIAAHAALDDPEFIKKSVTNNVNGLKQIQQGLASLQINYLPTAGNFITIDCKKDAISLYQRLQQKGIIVRPLHPYGLNNYLRITIGTEQQNSIFLNNLKELYNEK